VNHAQHCDHLEVEIERFATALEAANVEARVPSCPEWNVYQLAEHLGTIHRWSEYLVRVEAPDRVPSSAMGLELAPVDAAWLRRGGATLVATLRHANPDAPMWAWGADQHLRFWSRRQLHETMVHRVDLELAAGATSFVEPEVANDAIDEFLANLKGASYFSPKVKELRGDHQRLRFTSSDTPGDWIVELREDDFTVTKGSGTADAQLVGPALALMMVLYRRGALSDSDVVVRGDRSLIDFWTINSALE
jgi:uncharacterized protein (TIGR03083 family)